LLPPFCWCWSLSHLPVFAVNSSLTCLSLDRGVFFALICPLDREHISWIRTFTFVLLSRYCAPINAGNCIVVNFKVSSIHVLVLDACLDLATVGGPVTFTALNGLITISPNGLQRTKTGNSWDSAAYSTESFTSPNSSVTGVRFQVNQTTANMMLGLTRDTFKLTTTYSDIDYAFYLNFQGQLFASERGTTVAVLSTYVVSDTFEIRVSKSSTVEYLQNNVIVYTSSSAPVFPLVVDNSFHTAGATALNIVWSGKSSWCASITCTPPNAQCYDASTCIEAVCIPNAKVSALMARLCGSLLEFVFLPGLVSPFGYSSNFCRECG
jgi:hypothetical protein